MHTTSDPIAQIDTAQEADPRLFACLSVLLPGQPFPWQRLQAILDDHLERCGWRGMPTAPAHWEAQRDALVAAGVLTIQPLRWEPCITVQRPICWTGHPFPPLVPWTYGERDEILTTITPVTALALLAAECAWDLTYQRQDTALLIPHSVAWMQYTLPAAPWCGLIPVHLLAGLVQAAAGGHTILCLGVLLEQWLPVVMAQAATWETWLAFRWLMDLALGLERMQRALPHAGVWAAVCWWLAGRVLGDPATPRFPLREEEDGGAYRHRWTARTSTAPPDDPLVHPNGMVQIGLTLPVQGQPVVARLANVYDQADLPALLHPKPPTRSGWLWGSRHSMHHRHMIRLQPLVPFAPSRSDSLPMWCCSGDDWQAIPSWCNHTDGRPAMIADAIQLLRREA